MADFDDTGWMDFTEGPNFDAAQVKALREQTGNGMEACKRQLNREWMKQALAVGCDPAIVRDEELRWANLRAVLRVLVEKY